MSELPPMPKETPPEDFEGQVAWLNDRVDEILQQSTLERRAAAFSESLGRLLEVQDGIDFKVARVFTARREGETFIKQIPGRTEPFQAYWEMLHEGVDTDTFVEMESADKNQILASFVNFLVAPDIEQVDFSHPTQWVHKRQ